MTSSVAQRTLNDLLANAEPRITRYLPQGAHTAIGAGALLIDIRGDSDRRRDGIVPGSIHIPRTVLEWRTAPDSTSRNPHLGGIDQKLILLCDHGYSSILAASTLVEFGLLATGDVIGGFAAWRDAGLPVGRPPRERRRPDEPAGMRGPAR